MDDNVFGGMVRGKSRLCESNAGEKWNGDYAARD